MKFNIALLVGFLGLAVCSKHCVAISGLSDEKKDRSVRFFRFDLLVASQEIVREGFDLGDVHAGEQIKIQIYFRNATKTLLVLNPVSNSNSDVKLELEKLQIPPGTGSLVEATLTIPKSPKHLNTTFQMEVKLTDECRFFGLFKANILGVVAFVQQEFRYEFTESDSVSEILTISVPLLLSDVNDAKKVLARCDDSISFITTSVRVIDGKPMLQGTFYPYALDRSRYRGQIQLESGGHLVSSKMNLTVVRKGDVEILPERIVLKRKHGSSALVGEAVLRCRSGFIGQIEVDGETDNEDRLDCRLERMNERIGRVYFTLEPSNPPSGQIEEVLLRVSDGQTVRNVFVPISVAN